MSAGLNIGARALNTNQSVLNVIGHNIANANTVGYSRQSVSLSAVEGQQAGAGYYGKGVEILAVKRSYDAFLARQANATQTVASSDAVRYQKMQQVESLFPLGDGSLGTLLNKALNAWTDVQSSPTDSTARQVAIASADQFAARVRDTYTRLDEVGQTARLQATETVKSINQMATQLAELNDKISRVFSSGLPPNDLLDQRDKLLADLNKLVKTTTVAADDGSLTVFVASSQPLVIGNRSNGMSVDPHPLDTENRLQLNFVMEGSKTDISPELLGGGEIKGLIDFVNTDLNQAKEALGQMALATAIEVNNQHKSGLKPDGTVGGALFSFSVPVTPSAPSRFSLDFQSTGLQADDYVVQYSAASLATVQRLSDGKYYNPATSAFETAPTTIDFSTLTPPSDPQLQFDGISLRPTAAATVGETYRFSPTRDAARTLAVALSAPSELAVASAIGLSPASTNTGSTAIQSVGLSVQQGNLPAPVPTFNIQYNAGTGQFGIVAPVPANIQAPTTLTYTPGQPLVWSYDDGGSPANKFTYQLNLRGEPKNGDQFAIGLTTPTAARFNGGNATAMLGVRDHKVLDGTVALSDTYVAAFSTVASTVNETKFAAEFSAGQAAKAETQRANIAGVNLDEEAALLIQFQQAYQASAKYMNTVQSLFDTLISAFR
ncbi:MAG TPA: flagellar hook-associated protein FlgK [Burkholderiaceae bacterium]|nr:flagellar hook-associated protein FlgK [Burkholderiaceae bacterium]